MTIRVHQHQPDAAARVWLAVCTIDGQTFTARSRSGAAFVLARRLADAGLPDSAMIVLTHGRPGETRYRSFYEMAGHDVGAALQPA